VKEGEDPTDIKDPDKVVEEMDDEFGAEGTGGEEFNPNESEEEGGSGGGADGSNN